VIQLHSVVIDKDKARMLVADVGYKLASQETGIRQATLRQWARRFKWKSAHIHSQAVTTVTKPIAQAHTDLLAERRANSALHLAKYAEDAGKRLANSKGALKHARAFQQVAAGRANVFPEAAPSTAIQVNVLSFAAIKPPADE
jgi:hypothetical protein